MFCCTGIFCNHCYYRCDFLAYNSPKTVWRPGSARTCWRSLSAPPDPLAAKGGLLLSGITVFIIELLYLFTRYVCDLIASVVQSGTGCVVCSILS